MDEGGGEVLFQKYKDVFVIFMIELVRECKCLSYKL